MNLIKKGFLVLALCALLLSIASAQESASGISVISNPAGAQVILRGELTVAGVSPVTFRHQLQGRYEVEIKKHGFEKYSTIVYLEPGKAFSLNVDLTPKTRFKAMARSFFVPGWGQIYTDQDFKGGAFFLLTAGAVTSFLIAENDFQDKKDNYNKLLAEYNSENEFADKRLLYNNLQSAREEAYDAENIRRITIGLTAAVWALNLVDLLFYFPENRGDLVVGSSLSIKPDLEHGGAQLIFTHRF